MSLVVGTRLGVYEITALLGEGGMGAVYRARDTRLKRDVAIKVLLPEVANDPERLARFQREAEMLASLNHPNIAHIHGLEEGQAAGEGLAGQAGLTAPFLVLELVEGPTLADRIASSNGRGLPLDEALPIAKQIAEALEAAHEQGIIHRDLKPANIKVKDDGTVKVLDFGLAKAIERAGGSGKAGGPASVNSPDSPGRPGLPDLTASPTITSPAMMTGVGVLLGTAAYMSPEQAKGRPADKRADIWAFGCVLYEMLTAKRAFPGDDLTETLAAIVKDTPDLSAVPREVRRLLAKCLEKDPNKRLRSFSNWELLLDQSTAPVAASRRGAAVAGWLVAALFAAVAAGLAVLHYRAQPAHTEALVATLPLPASGRVGFIALSPDGTRVVIRAGDQNLWIRSLNSPDARKLTTSFTTRAPFWSPDSRFVAYFDGSNLMSVPASGGPAQQLCTIQGFEQGGSWSSTGVIVFGDDSGLQQVNATGGACTPLSRPSTDAGGSFPTFLPDGDHFFYVMRTDDATRRGVYVASLTDPNGRRLLADVSAVLYATPDGGRGVGHLLFRRGSALFAQPFDQKRLGIIGEPVAIADRVIASSDRVSPVASVSDNGRLVWVRDRTELSGDSRLVWLDGDGKRVGAPLATGAGFVSLSPDNRFALTEVLDDTNTDDLVLIDLSRAASSRISGFRSGASSSAQRSAPVWSPDSKQLLFLRAGDFYRRDVATGSESLVLRVGGNKTRFLGDWSRDGRYVFYTEVDAKTRGDIWYLEDPLGPAPRTVKLLGADSDETQPQLSPDGRWLMYSDLGTTRDIFIRAFPSGEGRWKVSLNGGIEGRWTPDGKGIVFRPIALGGGGLDYREFWTASFSVDRNGVPEIGAPRMLFSSPGGNSTGDRNEYRLVPAPGNRYLVSEYDGPPAPILNLVTDWMSLVPGLAR